MAVAFCDAPAPPRWAYGRHHQLGEAHQTGDGGSHQLG